MFSLSCCAFDCTTLSIAVAVFVLTLCYMRSRRKKDFPPGPRGLPIVGYVPFVSGNIGEKFFKMKGKYGSVMSVKIGSDDWVVLNDFDVMNEVGISSFDKYRPGLGLAWLASGYALPLSERSLLSFL